ncbi:unnamed protein product [Gordionus sp. m RMFG-2023]
MAVYTTPSRISYYSTLDEDYPIVYIVLYTVFLVLGLLINGGIFVVIQRWNRGNRAYYFLKFIICLNFLYCAILIAVIVEHMKIGWNSTGVCHNNLILKKVYVMIISAILDINHVLIVAYFYDMYLGITRADIKTIRQTCVYTATPYVILAVFFPPNIPSFFATVEGNVWVQNSVNAPLYFICNYVYSANIVIYNLIFDVTTISACSAVLVYILFRMIKFAARYSSLTVKPYIIDSFITTNVTTSELTNHGGLFNFENIGYYATKRRFLRRALIFFSLVLIYISLVFPEIFHRFTYFIRCKLGFCPIFFTSSQRVLMFLEMLCSVLMPILFVFCDRNLSKYFRTKSYNL